MNKNVKLGTRSAVSNVIFAISLVVLIVIAVSGFGLYATSLSHSGDTFSPSTSTEMMNHSSTSSEMMMTNSSSSEMSSTSDSYEFTPESGAMISNAWLLTAPIGMGEYALSIHAEGLEANGTYFVEGPLSNGAMQVVPVSSESMGMNSTSASEFQANSNGTGLFWIVLGHSPSVTFEQLELAYLPGMSMQNATIVASVSFAPMLATTTTAMMTESMTS